MSKWVLLKDKKPKKHVLCDFLYNGTPDLPEVWMMCSAQLWQTDFFIGEVVMWRPAKPLPEGIEPYDDGFEYEDEND